jgi:hypothetical protein
MKERSRYNYRYKSDSLLPVLNIGDPDCSIEITTLKNTPLELVLRGVFEEYQELVLRGVLESMYLPART